MRPIRAPNQSAKRFTRSALGEISLRYLLTCTRADRAQTQLIRAPTCRPAPRWLRTGTHRVARYRRRSSTGDGRPARTACAPTQLDTSRSQSRGSSSRRCSRCAPELTQCKCIRRPARAPAPTHQSGRPRGADLPPIPHRRRHRQGPPLPIARRHPPRSPPAHDSTPRHASSACDVPVAAADARPGGQHMRTRRRYDQPAFRTRADRGSLRLASLALRTSRASSSTRRTPHPSEGSSVLCELPRVLRGCPVRACDEIDSRCSRPQSSPCALLLIELSLRRFERVARGNFFYCDALRVVSYADVRASLPSSLTRMHRRERQYVLRTRTYPHEIQGARDASITNANVDTKEWCAVLYITDSDRTAIRSLT